MTDAVNLRNYTYKDTTVLQQYQYNNVSIEDIQNMISEWDKKSINGKYFEMFAIEDKNIVGSISLYQHSQNIISCGLEIFPSYRRQGYGKEAMKLALLIAKEKGYKIAAQQIRTDNIASIALHEALGFESDNYTYINKKGNRVNIYLKDI